MKWAFFVILCIMYNFQCLSHVFGLQRHKKSRTRHFAACDSYYSGFVTS